jgi:hypothetical protein
MRYYIAKHTSCEPWTKNIDPWDAPSLFHALARAGVFEDPLIFNRLSLLVERALWQGSFPSDADYVLIEFEKLLARLGIPPVNSTSPSANH